MERERDYQEHRRQIKERLMGLYTGIERVPSCEHYFTEEDAYFKWFRINNKDDFSFVRELVVYGGLTEPSQYPAYVCLIGESDPLDDDQLCAEYAVWVEP